MSLWRACLLTMALETGFFAAAGFRSRAFLGLCLAANAATNLALNLLLGSLGFSPALAVLLELGVLAAEYGAYALMLGRSKKLFLLTLAANALSLGLGGLLLGLPR